MPKKIHSIIEKSCLYCGTLFETTTRETNRGNGKYCSLSCSARNRKSSPKIPNVPNVVKNFIEIRARKAVPKVDCFFVIENVKMRLKKLED